MDRYRRNAAVPKYLVNPIVRALARIRTPPGVAILETTGRKSGQPRQVPVGNGLDGDTFWIVTEHGRRAGYVRNIEANPRVRVVYAGTRQVYGRPDYVPTDERHPVRPTDINGIHKAAAEQYHLLYAERHGIGTCSLRISNPYGPGQDRPDRAFGVVGTFLARAANGDDITLYGGGGQKRPVGPLPAVEMPRHLRFGFRRVR